MDAPSGDPAWIAVWEGDAAAAEATAGWLSSASIETRAEPHGLETRLYVRTRDAERAVELLKGWAL